MSAFEQPSAYGSWTFKPVVPEASPWPIGCPEVAVTVNSRPSQEDAMQDYPIDTR
jgi:hypothetical protein